MSWVALPFLLLLLVGVLVPSDGNHGLFSIKSLTFLMAGGAIAALLIVRQRLFARQAKILLAFCSVVAIFCFWLLLAMGREGGLIPPSMDQMKVVVITLAIPTFGLFLIREGVMTPRLVFQTVIYANCFYCAAKVGLVLLHLFHFINLVTFLEKLGLRFMTMHIVGSLGRMQTSVDILTPFLFFFALTAPRLGIRWPRGFLPFFIGVSCLSNLLSFSRFLIAIYFLSLTFVLLTLTLKEQLKWGLVVVMLLASGMMAAGPGRVMEAVERRLFSHVNTLSDKIRMDQTEAMLVECADYPMLGKGLGGHSPTCIRDTHLPYSYEVQWISFLMQFGFLGITGLLGLSAGVFYRFRKLPTVGLRLGYGALFSLWLLSGLTNPFLISLTSGLVYFLFLTAPEAVEEAEQLMFEDGTRLAFRRN